jgi:branched-chain amino acid aminotransferase
MEYVDERWSSPRIQAYGFLGLEPGTSSLHYAQTIFEGLKAHRGKDGVVRLFRPEAHAKRFVRSAGRLCIPPVDPEVFVEACKQLVSIDVEWVPSDEGASLYVRPLALATEEFLGVRPALRYELVIMTSPVGAYYAEGFAPVRILVEREQVRAPEGGLGDAKTGANYAASLLAGLKAKKNGYAQVLWTDAKEHRYVEEVGTMNIFFRIGDEVITPPLDGTILPGITRDSVIQLLRRRGTHVVERRITLDEIRDAHAAGELSEAFGTGTAAVVSPVAAFGLNGEDMIIGDGGVGTVAQSLFEEITAIQHGEADDVFGWMVPVS